MIEGRGSFESPKSDQKKIDALRGRPRENALYTEENTREIVREVYTKYQEAKKKDENVKFNFAFFRKCRVPGAVSIYKLKERYSKKLPNEKCSSKEFIGMMFGTDSEIYKEFTSREYTKWSRDKVEEVVEKTYEKFQEMKNNGEDVVFNRQFFKEHGSGKAQRLVRNIDKLGPAFFGNKWTEGKDGFREFIGKLLGEGEIYSNLKEKNIWTDEKVRETIKEIHEIFKKMRSEGENVIFNLNFFIRYGNEKSRNLAFRFYYGKGGFLKKSNSFKDVVERLFREDEKTMKEIIGDFHEQGKGIPWDFERFKKAIKSAFEEYKERKKINSNIVFNTSFFCNCGLKEARRMIKIFKDFPIDEGEAKNLGEFIKMLFGEGSEIYRAFTYKEDLERTKRSKEKEVKDISSESVYDPEYKERKRKLLELNKKLKGLREKKRSEKREDYFFGYGKCFEHFVGLLLAMESKNIEHQYKIETPTSFRLVDFYINGQGFVSAEELNELIEVKSGLKLSKHDKEQLKDFLRQSDKISYIVHDESAEIVKKLIVVAEELDKKIQVVSFSDLKSFTRVSEHELTSIFVDKKKYIDFEKEKDKDQLETDLFSVYMWAREENGIDQSKVNDILDAVYKQDEDFKEYAAEVHNMRWFTTKEYNDESMMVFSSERGRYFDLELANKKLESKIMKAQAEIAVSKSEKEYKMFMKRKDNFFELESLMEKIPDNANKWGNPPIQYFYYKEKPVSYLLVKTEGDEKIYEVNGIDSHKRKIREWINSGKVLEKYNKYFEDSLKRKHDLAEATFI